MLTTCHYCGKSIVRKPYFVKRVKYNYCDQQCMAKKFSQRCKTPEKIKGHCPQCSKPVFRQPSALSHQKFCNEDCYKKWRGKGPSVKVQCAVCGSVFYKSPKSKRETCSKKCGYANLSAKRTTTILCKNCDKPFRKWTSYANQHSVMLCSMKCFVEYNKLSTSFSWKGGSYKSSQGCVMILLGRYNYKSASKDNFNLKYKRRHRVIAELYLGYDLQNSASVLMINGSEQLSNLYVCQSHSEHLKIINGSLPMPNKSNLQEIKNHQLCKAEPTNYTRLPDEFINELVSKSFAKG